MIIVGMAVIVGKCGPKVVLPGFKVTSCLTVVLLICLETVLLCTESNCSKSFYVHWNTTNSIFRIDNTDHIIDVNRGNVKFEYDQVNIICPVYRPGTIDEDTEKYIIYNVSKEEYETCRITNPNPRIIAICDKPFKLMYFTITFRPFTPQPGGLEFLPGNDYYFISTSSKDDLHRRVGGRCSTHNMKIVFKVCCAADEDAHGNNSVARIAAATTPSSISWPMRPSLNPGLVTAIPTTLLFSPATDTPPTHKPTKKTKDHDKNLNEVVKNELTLSIGVRLSPGYLKYLVVLSVLFACVRWR